MLRTIVIAAAGLLLATQGLADEINLLPGLYEVRTTMMRGQGTLREQTETECITADDLANASEKMVQGLEQMEGECSAKEWNFDNGKITGGFQCDMGMGSALMEINGQYTRTTFEMNNVISMDMGGMQMRMSTESKAKRISDC